MQESRVVAKDAKDVHPLFERAVRLHQARFGRDASIFVAAPGRVNLIGEHTDYNDGFVFPMAIERYVGIAASRPEQAAGHLRVQSDAIGAAVEIAVGSKPLRGEPKWANYVRGVVAGFLERGYTVPALDLTIKSSVPLGAGLSSSAALEVAVASALETAIGVQLEPLDKARLCQKAEHEYALVPCGLMDQLASVFGRRAHALFVDCRTQQPQLVPLSDPEVSVLICNSNVRHSLADGEYGKRRAQCEHAAAVLGVKSLRDTALEGVLGAGEQLDELHLRRARHVVSENQRAQDFKLALDAGDLPRAGQLMYESHISLRGDYEVSCKELDLLVDTARELGLNSGVYGSRMTGGGFGGCTVSLVRTERVDTLVASLTARYLEVTGKRLDAFVTQPSEGMVWQA
jgi:galactokinase